ETARIPVKRGRTFTVGDSARTAAVAVVNEELARRWLDGRDPIGARLLVDDNDGPPRPIAIVGVVGNVPQIALAAEPTLDLSLPCAQIRLDNAGAAAGSMFWIVRTSGDPQALGPVVASAIRGLDPDVAAAQVRSADAYLSDAVAPRRFSLSLMATFAAAALAL